MKKDTKVSIVVPVYNCESYIRRCVDSLINQTWTNIEIILVDDGSSDMSGTICDEIKLKDDRIMVFHKNNEGLGKTRNKGMQLATGKYIMFIDSDDYIDAHGVENMINIAEKYQVEIVSSEFIYGDKVEKLTIQKGLYEKSDIKKLIAYMLGKVADNEEVFNVSSCTKLYKVSFLKKIHAEFPSEKRLIWEDMAFNIYAMLKCNKIYVSDLHYYYYCYNEASLTHKYDAKKFSKIMDMYTYIMDIIEHNNLQYDARRRFNNTIMGNIRTCIKLEVFHKEKIGKRVVLKNIKKLCDDERVKKILSEIDIIDENMQQRIYSIMLRKKKVYFVYLLAKIQNVRKHNKIN